MAAERDVLAARVLAAAMADEFGWVQSDVDALRDAGGVVAQLAARGYTLSKSAPDLTGMEWLVDDSIHRGVISVGRGAELLGVSVRDMRAIGIRFRDERAAALQPEGSARDGG